MKLRYLFRLIIAFVSRFKVIIFFGLGIGIVIFFALNIFGATIFDKQVEIIGISGRFQRDSLPQEILNNVSNGLTAVDESGNVIPKLAKSWESPDKGKTWIFHLSDNYFWQDGKAVDTASLNYEFSDVEIEKPDSKTIIFKLKNEFSPFPLVVSSPVFKKGLLGTGDWKVTAVQISGGYIQKLTLKSKSNKTRIYKFYPTEERAKLAFKLGEINILKGIYNSAPLNNWKNNLIKEYFDYSKEVLLFFNNEDEMLSDKNLRQALSYAINKNNLPGERAIGPISISSWAFNPQVKPYNYDKLRASELIEGLPKEAKINLEIKLVTSPLLLDVAEAIAKDWESVGIKTLVQVSSGIPNEYQALIAIYDIPLDPDQYSLWHSTQTGSNVANYKDARIDKLLEAGRSELALEERRKIYLDFQRFLLEDAPAVFLYYPKTFEITRK